MKRSVCIVGAGIGAEHARGYAALPDRFLVHGICDLDRARGQALADTCQGARMFNDFKDVLADPQVDIVDICLPPHLHFSSIVAVLEAGKIAVCEKPLVASLADADAVAQVIDRTGGIVAPVFQYRYGTGTAQLRALIVAGVAGACYAGTLETHWNRDAAYYAVPWRGTWAGERGGALLGHAIHIHDLLSCLLGPVAQVFADTATRVNAIEVEDCASLSIRMASGARIASSVTLGAADDTSRLRLCFEGFTVESDHSPYAPAAAPWTFTARAPTTQAQIEAVLACVPPAGRGFAGMFEVLAEALDGRGSQAVTFADGRRSLEFVTAAYASARANAPVALPLGRDHPMYESWLPDPD